MTATETTALTDFEWVPEPPPATHGGSATTEASQRLQQIAEMLRSRPGQWALIRRNGSSTFASVVSRGGSPAFRDGRFEAVARNCVKGRGDIYARYIGD